MRLEISQRVKNRFLHPDHKILAKHPNKRIEMLPGANFSGNAPLVYYGLKLQHPIKSLKDAHQ
jgi:hypothetical protein